MSTRCRHKGSTVLTTLAGYEVRLDTEPLDPLAELVAAVAGRRTYTAYASGGASYRDGQTIRARPAGTRPRETVRVQHQCPPSITPGAS